MKKMTATATEVKNELEKMLTSEDLLEKMENVTNASIHQMCQRDEWNADFFMREFLLIQRKRSKQPSSIRTLIMRTVNTAIKYICQRKEAS